MCGTPKMRSYLCCYPLLVTSLCVHGNSEAQSIVHEYSNDLPDDFLALSGYNNRNFLGDIRAVPPDLGGTTPPSMPCCTPPPLEQDTIMMVEHDKKQVDDQNAFAAALLMNLTQ